MESSSPNNKALVRIKFEGREVEPSRFSSKVNGKSCGWSVIAV